jgi:hypothetical protein
MPFVEFTSLEHVLIRLVHLARLERAGLAESYDAHATRHALKNHHRQLTVAEKSSVLTLQSLLQAKAPDDLLQRLHKHH